MGLLSSILLITILITTIVKLIIYHYKRLDLYRASSKIPGPRPVIPIFGNPYYVFGDPAELTNKIMALLKNYKLSPVRIWLGHRFFVILSNPEQMKIVFYSPKAMERDETMKFFCPWLGTGLLTAPVKEWKVLRKLIMPTFHPRILESYIDTMDQKAKTMVKVMESELNRDEFDVLPYISRCTLDIICETAMGVASNEQVERNTIYPQALEKILRIIYQRMANVWLHADIIFNVTQLGRDQAKCIKYLHQYTNDVINQKRQQYSEKINDNDDLKQTTKSRRKALLDLLMDVSNEGGKLTNIELREGIDATMIAANSTSAIVISFILLMLANFPEIQEKCYEELVGIFGDKIDKGRKIEDKDLSRMEYLGRVIKETMRLFPALPVIVRQLTDDLDIGEGYTLPKGSTTVLAVLNLHRSSEIWDDPLSFNPDRFLPEQVAKRHPCAYVPFGLGPRNCAGLAFAMMSMKILLARLLRNYVLVKDKHVNIEDIKIKSEMFLQTVDPITLKIKRR